MHGLDLRDLRGVETFCAFIAERHEALDVLVNNACQTVRRFVFRRPFACSMAWRCVAAMACR